MYIPDPTELIEQLIENQIDLIENNTYPCIYCNRRFPIDEMQIISDNPASPLECGQDDCNQIYVKKVKENLKNEKN